MDVGKNATLDSKQLFAGFGNRSSGSLDVDGTGGGSGGLLETFDAVFRATTPVRPTASAPETRRAETGRTPSGDGELPSRSSVSESARVNEDQDSGYPLQANVFEAENTFPAVASEGESVGLEEIQAEAAEAELLSDEASAVVTAESVNDADAADLPDDVEEASGAEELASSVLISRQAQTLPTEVPSAFVVSNGEEAVAASSEQVEGEGVSSLLGKQVSAASSAADFATEKGAAVTENVPRNVEEDARSQAGVVVKDSEKLDERGRRVGARYKNEKTAGTDSGRDIQSNQDVAASVEELSGEQRELMLKLRQLSAEQASEQGMGQGAESQPSPSDVMSDLQTSLPLQKVGLERSLANFLANQSSQNNQSSEAEPSGESRVGFVDGAKRQGGGAENIAGQTRPVERGTNETQVRLVQRVARALQRLGPDGGRVNIMLHPAELGSVKLELKIDGQAVSAKMIAESDTAMSVLRDNLPDLKQKLVDSGMVVEKIEIEVAGRETDSGRGDTGRGGFQFGQDDRKRQGNTGGQWGGLRGTRPAAVEVGANEIQRSLDIRQPGGRRSLDLKI